MPTRDEMIHAVEEYCRTETARDKAGFVALFTEDAVYEDPVGLLRNEGHEEIGAFWDSFQSFDLEIWVTEPPIACGNELIALLRCKYGPAGARQESGRIVNNYVFADDGRFAAVRSFHEHT